LIKFIFHVFVADTRMELIEKSMVFSKLLKKIYLLHTCQIRKNTPSLVQSVLFLFFLFQKVKVFFFFIMANPKIYKAIYPEIKITVDAQSLAKIYEESKQRKRVKLKNMRIEYMQQLMRDIKEKLAKKAESCSNYIILRYEDLSYLGDNKMNRTDVMQMVLQWTSDNNLTYNYRYT
jgi:hypothetical protein